MLTDYYILSSIVGNLFPNGETNILIACWIRPEVPWTRKSGKGFILRH